MSYKIPSFLYLSRVVLLLSTLLSLLFLEPATTAVIYLVVLAISFCEYYIQNKYFAGSIGSCNNIIFGIIDRVVVLMPLLFMVINKVLAAWVFVLMIGFEVAVFLYRNLDLVEKKFAKISLLIYIVYNLSIYISIICFLLGNQKVAAVLLFASTILAAAYVVFSSLLFGAGSDCGENLIAGNEKDSGNSIINAEKGDNEIVE